MGKVNIDDSAVETVAVIGQVIVEKSPQLMIFPSQVQEVAHFIYMIVAYKVKTMVTQLIRLKNYSEKIDPKVVINLADQELITPKLIMVR